MAEWLTKVSGRLKKVTDAFKGSKPLAEVLPEMIDPGDPRVVIRPLGGDWLCPFTGRCIPCPSWDGSSLSLLKCQEILDHLLGQPELQKLGAKSPMKTFDEMVQVAIFMRLSSAPNYKFAAPGGEWVCPYCMNKTEILMRNWDGSDTEPTWFIPAALKHFAACADYQQDPIGGAKSVAEITEAGGDRARVKKLLATDPRFRVCDPAGSWYCPYSMRPIAQFNLKREAWPALQAKILEYIMSANCPGRYSQFNIEKSLEELQQAALVKPAVL